MATRKAKLAWYRVTNEFVVTFAQEGCANCEGAGYVGDESSGLTICSCAALAFRREMVETGHVRQRNQQIGNRNVTWQEYRNITSVSEPTK